MFPFRRKNIQFLQYKNHYVYGNPHKFMKTQPRVCLCVCIDMAYKDMV